MSTVAPLLPRAVIIVLNWNGASDTVACAQSLLRLDYPNFQIVLCDNASRLDQRAILLEWGHSLGGQFCAHDSLDAALSAAGPCTHVTLIQTGGNLGYAGGMNVGMRYALADPEVQYCWVLNNDTEVDPAALTELVRRAQSDSRIGLCGSSLVLHHDRGRMQAFGGASYNRWRARSAAIGINAALADIPADPSAVEARMAYVIGASMLVSRRYLEEVGLMDESYFLYSEEHDWAERGRARFRLGYAPRSLVFHKHGATIGTASSGGSELSLFYLFRNKLAFTRRHTPWLYAPALLSLLWEAVKFLLKRQKPKARAALKGLRAERKMKSWIG
jgi:GT2 family glycosyltransferase